MNWHLILIDDVSDLQQRAECSFIIDKFENIEYDKVTVIWNDTKLYETANVLKGISMCSDDDIICRIDADDYLTDLDALAIVDAAYTQTGCDVLWSKHRWGLSDKNISGPMPDNVDPYNFPWVSSHLKTFRKQLINNINDLNFRGEDGDYIRRTGDQALFLPLLKNAKKRVFIDRVLYHYTIDDVPATYQTSDARFQRDEALFLRKRGYVP
jgi:glycosyltransferase involved in cell wall biosynthesis